MDQEELHRLMLVFLSEKTNPEPRDWFAPDRDVYGHCLFEFHQWVKHFPPRAAVTGSDDSAGDDR